MLVLALPLLPGRGKTKSAGIVLGINELLLKPTPSRPGSLVTAAGVSWTECLVPHRGHFEARKRPFLDDLLCMERHHSLVKAKRTSALLALPAALTR